VVDLSTSLDDAPWAFVDVETTGLRPLAGDRVCEVAILRCHGDQVVDALQRLVDPQRPMGSVAYAVHGISDDMLRGAPTFREVSGQVLDLLEGAVPVGHNTPFDLGFLASELSRVRSELPPLVALDTLRLARHSYRLPRYGLGALARSLGIEMDGSAHRAMVDVLLTRAILRRIIDDQWARGARTVADLVSLQGGAVKWGLLPNLDIPPIIQDALDGAHHLYLRYRSEAGDDTERLVRPLRVVDRDGNLLLIAHCLLRDAQRSFRIDRIVDAELIESFA
jgi:DNA polymerase III epsilon subunit family exonuclease